MVPPSAQRFRSGFGSKQYDIDVCMKPCRHTLVIGGVLPATLLFARDVSRGAKLSTFKTQHDGLHGGQGANESHPASSYTFPLPTSRRECGEVSLGDYAHAFLDGHLPPLQKAPWLAMLSAARTHVTMLIPKT